MPDDLIQILRRRRDGTWTESDQIIFFKTVDRVIGKVYSDRCGKLIPVDIIKKREDGDNRGTDRFVPLEFEAFQNACWDAMCSGGALQRRMDAIEFRNDENKEVTTYLYAAFLSMLSQRLDDQIPFWNSRKKQIMIILRDDYEPVMRGGKKYWRMHNARMYQPATHNQLEAAVIKAGGLNIKYPKGPDSKRGPSIAKKDMEAYIVKLFNYCGGMVAETDLLEAVKVACGLKAVIRVEPQNEDPESSNQEQDPFDRILLNAEQKSDALAISGYDHRIMAQEIFEGMTARMKDNFYLRRLQGLGVVDVATKMQCATGAVSETFNETAEYILEYFCGKGANSFPSTEEMNNVTDLVGLLVLEEKERL